MEIGDEVEVPEEVAVDEAHEAFGHGFLAVGGCCCNHPNWEFTYNRIVPSANNLSIEMGVGSSIRIRTLLLIAPLFIIGLNLKIFKFHKDIPRHQYRKSGSSYF